MPTFFVTAENDVTSPPGPIIEDHDTTAVQGTSTELLVAEEQPLGRDRFLRIPGIDEAEADATFQSLTATGSWDAAGRRLLPVAEVIARAAAADLPASVRPVRNEILNQCALVLAAHQMRGDVKVPAGEFFDAHLD